METFVWDDNFTTGLELVDQQHRRLVELIDRRGDSLIAGTAKDDDALQVIFKQLADYAQYHFSEEERLMLESGVAPATRPPKPSKAAPFPKTAAPPRCSPRCTTAAMCCPRRIAISPQPMSILRKECSNAHANWLGPMTP